MKRYFILLLAVASICFMNPVQALTENDTLIVYFSHNRSVNALYTEHLKFRFPNMNIRSVENMESFYSYIPEDQYTDRNKLFGIMQLNAQDIMKMSVKEQGELLKSLTPTTDTLNLKYKTPVSYYFFDISSKKEKEYYFVQEGNMSIQKFRWVLKHNFNLVHFNGKQFTNEMTMRLWVNDDQTNISSIPVYQMDYASDWINPLLVSMYSVQHIKKNIYSVDKALKPCFMEKGDTVYICDILAPRNMFRGFVSLDGHFSVPHQVDFFERTHYKLGNTPFSELALQNMRTGKHFYFYFYLLEVGKYFIIDALTMEVLYFEKAGPYLQEKKEVRKFSDFDKKCK